MTIIAPDFRILWATVNSKSVAFGATAVSDAVSFQENAVEAWISIAVKKDGTPATKDDVAFSLRYTSGTIGVGDSYDTALHQEALFILPTDDGDDPAQQTIKITNVTKGFKLVAVNASAGRAITIRASIQVRRE